MTRNLDADAFRDTFPAELASGAVWLVSRADDKAPCRIDGDRLVRTNGADSVDGKHALGAVLAYCAGHPGTFPTRVLQRDDPFWVLDLDLKPEGASPRKAAFFAELVNRLSTYTEVSSGGRGLHIWGRGKIPGEFACREGEFDLEFYREARHIISTGWAVRRVEAIDDRVEVVEVGVHPVGDGGEFFRRSVVPRFAGNGAVRPVSDTITPAPASRELTEGERTTLDRALQDDDFRAAYTADKESMKSYGIGFKDGVFDHSAAEYWLARRLSDICRTSDAVFQLFMGSDLVRLTKFNSSTGEFADRYSKKILGRADYVFARTITRAWSERAAADFAGEELSAKSNQGVESVALEVGQDRNDQIVFPVDAAGQLTPSGAFMRTIHRGLNRKLDSVSITAALSVLSTLAGRAYNIDDSRTASVRPTGLNLYMVLCAPQGTGKESMADAISDTGRQVDEYADAVLGWQGYDEPEPPPWLADDETLEPELFTTAAGLLAKRDCASGQALRNNLNRYRTLLHVSGEFGKILSGINAGVGTGSGGFDTMKREMLDKFMKSGRGSRAGDVVYADRGKLVKGDFPVSYTLVGETTRDSFQLGLSPACLQDGFVSRFLALVHEGERPPIDWQLDAADTVLPDIVKHNLAIMRRNCTANIFNDRVITFSFSDTAVARFQSFVNEQDKLIEAAEKAEDILGQATRVRMGLLAKRVAGLLAICDSPEAPVVELHHINWAVMLVNRSRDSLARLAQGAGSDIEARVAAVREVIAKWHATRDGKFRGGRFDLYRRHGIIPMRFFHKHLARRHCFRSHRAGEVRALDEVLETMCGTGQLDKVSPEAIATIIKKATGQLPRGNLGRLYQVQVDGG